MEERQEPRISYRRQHDPRRLHYNHLIVVGRIVTPIERVESEAAGMFASFIIASDRFRSGERIESLQIRVNLFDSVGEAALTELHQGDTVAASGRLYMARRKGRKGEGEVVIVCLSAASVSLMVYHKIPPDCVLVTKDELERLRAFEREELEIPIEKQRELGLAINENGKLVDPTRPYVEDEYGRPL